MNYLRTQMLRTFVAAQLRLVSRERGQGALEYIAMVVGLILLVAAGFKFAGGQIFEQAGRFVSDVLDAAN